MNVYKDIRKKRRLRAEKEIQDAYRNLDQMLGRTNLSDQISDKTEIAKPTNPTLESITKTDFKKRIKDIFMTFTLWNSDQKLRESYREVLFWGRMECLT